MKSLVFVIATIFASASYAADNTCFQFTEGPKDITIGWFSKVTYTADTLCVPATYPEVGWTESFDFVLKSGTTVVATFKAAAERYSDTDIRFTLENGEPEPQQYDAKVSKKSKTLVEVEGMGYLIPLSSGGAYKCIESDGPLGYTRSLTLEQIEDSTLWQLNVWGTVVVPNAKPELIRSVVLNVTLMEDVQFFLANDKENVFYNIYMDELYATYLYLDGAEGDSITFNCEM